MIWKLFFDDERYPPDNDHAWKIARSYDDEMHDVPGKNGKVYRNYKNMVWAWEHNCRLTVVPPLNMKEIEENAKQAAKLSVQAWRTKTKYGRLGVAA